MYQVAQYSILWRIAVLKRQRSSLDSPSFASPNVGDHDVALGVGASVGSRSNYTVSVLRRDDVLPGSTGATVPPTTGRLDSGTTDFGHSGFRNQ